MSVRRSFLWTASAALTVFLVVFFFKISKLDWGVTVQQLRSVSRTSFAALIALTGLHVYLSSLKWRCVDARLRHGDESAPSRTMSFALTSIGVALGQVLPVQLSMSVARTLGTYFHGRALQRGTGGTLFEQTFDVLVVVVLVAASGITLLFKGGGLVWVVCATATAAVAMLAVGPMIGLIRRWEPTQHFILRKVAAMRESGLLHAGLGRQLMALSLARFAIQVLMAGVAAEAVGVHIPLWHFAAAMPFVIIACVLVVTPAGLGVNELSYATTLQLFGTPFHAGAQWAVANRFLVATSCLVVAAGAIALLGLARLTAAAAPAERLQEE